MAFAYAVTARSIVGKNRSVSGTFTNGTADSGGDIVTGLSYIENYGLEVTSHVGSSKPKCTVSGGTITIVCPNDVDGVWNAVGR